MKKFFSALCFLAVLSGISHAAPYRFDAPAESYTWGESMQTVMSSDRDARWKKISGDQLVLQPTDDEPPLYLTFYHDRLIRMSGHHSPLTTQQERDALYNRYLEDFTARWGKPSPTVPCPANPAFCEQMIWNVTDKTLATLSYSTAQSERVFIGYGYLSREIWPEYQEEIRKFGIRYPLKDMIHFFREYPEKAEKHQKALKEKQLRFRIQADVVSSMPLRLEDGGYEIRAILRDKQDAKQFEPGQTVIVSGIVEGVKNDRLQLSDVILVPPAPEAAIGRGCPEKRTRGFFTAETLVDQLETAANQVSRDLSILEIVSDLRLEGRRAVLDFQGEKIPDGISLSLEPLYADQSGDTIVFQANVKENAQRVDGLFVAAILGIMVKTARPGAPEEEIWQKIQDILEGNGGKTVINGWTYQSAIRDERNFRFSVTAPRCRK